MHILLPLAYLLVQIALLVLLPAQAALMGYLLVLMAPALCAVTLWRRSLGETGGLRSAWRLLALSMLIWAGAAFGNFWVEFILGHRNEMNRWPMLVFQLAAVPVVYLLASETLSGGRRAVRVIDAVMALTLCGCYFLVTWGMLTARGTPDDAGVLAMVRLVDAQNLFFTLGAFLRCYVARLPGERQLFGKLAAFELLYTALVWFNDRYLAPNPGINPEWGSIITLAFALLAGLALGPGSSADRQPLVDLKIRRMGHSARPILLAGTLIAVSLLLIRLDYAMGVVGVSIGVLGYGLRNVLTHVRQMAYGDHLQRRHRELQAIAWTDALTGVANRHYLAHAMAETWRTAPLSGRLTSVLMLDIDHFKLLNDRQGHVIGDSCLRRVAAAMQRALTRPEDLLVRYGGEEFMALLQDTDAEGALVVGDRLRLAVEHLRIANPGSSHGQITVSVGCATAFVRSDVDTQQLVQAADATLYQAKLAGRNRIVA